MTTLSGQVAIVTGGGAGIGAAISAALSEAGATVAIVDLDLDAAAATAAALPGARPYRCDVSESAAVDALVAAVVADFGRLDILVNNAGVSFVGPTILETTDQAWNTCVGVMQSGVFYGMRAAGRVFAAQGSGRIVNISSIRGFSPNPGRVAYCATKAAVIMMTKVAAAELAPYGVTVNAIAPGVQATPMWVKDVELGVCDEERVLRVTPAGRLGDPAEIGRLAVFLAGPDAAFINGSCVTIDGALTAVPVDGEVIRP